jgi:hypothetical protein
MPVMMVSPRDYTLRTTSGHVIAFKANVPQLVPDVVVSDAMAVNILPCEGKAVDNDRPADGVVKMPALPSTLRDALVLTVIDQLVRENDTANFNAGGQPKLAVVNELTGVRLSSGELSKYWDRYREIKYNNESLPTHKHLSLVMELQSLTTRKQLIEFARDIRFPTREVERQPSVKDAKALLLNAVLNYHEPLASVEEAKADGKES